MPQIYIKKQAFINYICPLFSFQLIVNMNFYGKLLAFFQDLWLNMCIEDNCCFFHVIYL